MANSKLVNKYVNVPSEYVKYIKNDKISYANLKKKKHIFDNLNLSDSSDKNKFEQMGGYRIKEFVNNTLNKMRKNVKHSGEMKSGFNYQDSMMKDIKDLNKIEKTNKNNINSVSKSSVMRDNIIKENAENNNLLFQKKASLVIVENDNNEFLLLKRSRKDTFKPLHWGFPGGGSNEGDIDEEYTAKRELLEETLLDVKSLKLLSKKLYNDTLCYIYTCKVDELDPLINYEHEEYGWFTLNKIKNLKTVDGVYEDIKEYVSKKKKAEKARLDLSNDGQGMV